MYILGISCYYHDSAAALIKDGKIIAAAEEERFSRKKHDFGFPHLSIDFCLNQAGISSKDIAYVVFYEKPFRKLDRIMKTIVSTYPWSRAVFGQVIKKWLTKKLWIKSTIQGKLNIESERILFCEHHLSHAASAFLLSPFKQAAILTIDGVGEWATGTLGLGQENQIKLFKQINFPHSLGLLYSAFTAYLGFEVNEGEYKVMGMAAYGQPRFADKIRANILSIAEDGSFNLNLDYFSFQHSAKKSFSKKLETLFGPSRALNSDFFTDQFDYPSYFGKKPADYLTLCVQNQYFADIAASIQNVLEEIILKQVKFLYQQTGVKQLCIAGGVALNSTANGRILQSGPFEQIYIQPAPGDSGAAIGAALYVYHTVLNQKREHVLENAYLGQEYSNQEIADFLTKHKISAKKYESSELLEICSQAIADGKIIGWFQGRFEWGPRALGNRSIIADPRDEKMKEIVNAKIKFREPFRPFAPVILEKELENFFEIKNPKQYPLRFMLFVLGIKPDKRKIIPAVDHQGTGRVQTINQQSNPLYYGLLKAFAQKTGVPLLLNTSFNLKGEPIVNTPENAYNTFMSSGLDLLVLGDYIIYKDENHEKNNQ
ncbi:MAG: carbamoyltransferase [Candidatus Omnitrophica bacterium]|nr:carbamoyltransferase [Candidatus Omnitrophota bacterium]